MTTRRNKSTVVIDTNLFISAFIRGGAPFKLLNAWQQEKFSLAITEDLLKEIVEVLSRPYIYQKYSLDKNELQKFLKGITLNAKFITPLDIHKLPIHSRDPKDDELLACAIAGLADYLVTGDKDLLVLNGSPRLANLKIITVKEFLETVG